MRIDRRLFNPTLLKLGLISFLGDIASEMLYPITPLFLTGVLGASMTSLGIIEGCAEGIASLLKTYSGYFSDKIGRRKPFILVGYFLAAISKPMIGLSLNWTHVFMARAIDRTGKGLRTSPRDALIDDSVPSELRGAAFGLHRLMDTLGAVIGPLIAMLYLSIYGADLRSAYYFAFIPGIVAFLIVFTLKDRKNIPKKRSVFKWDFSHFKPGFKKYLVVWGVFCIANSSDVFLLMKAKQQGFSVNLVILFYCLYNLTYSLTSPFFGRLSDQLGRKKVLVVGLCFFTIVYSGFIFATDAWMFWVLFGAYGFYMGATDGVGKALVMDFATPEFKASAQGLFGTVTGIGAIIASIIAGMLWDGVGSSWAFGFAILGALGAIFLLLFYD